jgi:hypothetical protein
MDLAVANSGSNSVSILQNNGSGIFTLIDTVTVGSFPFSTTPMDIDGDGAIDLAVSNLNSNTISILTNDGSGTLTQTSTIAVTTIFKAAADIDGDGDLDLIVPYYDSTTVLQNNGSGTFSKKSVLNTGSLTRMVIATDLNNDGTMDFAGVNQLANSVSIYLNEGTTDVKDAITAIPTRFDLAQNFPNPFNPSTTVQFDLPKSTHVTLSVYNILGALVTTLLDEDCSAGSYSVRWNGQAKNGSLASGIYFTVIRAGDFRKTVKMVLMK